MMKAAKIAAVLLVVCLLINGVRQGADFPIGRVLPFCSGDVAPLFEVGGLVMLGLLFWGLRRLYRSADSAERQDRYEYDEPEEYDVPATPDDDDEEDDA